MELCVSLQQRFQRFFTVACATVMHINAWRGVSTSTRSSHWGGAGGGDPVVWELGSAARDPDLLAQLIDCQLMQCSQCPARVQTASIMAHPPQLRHIRWWLLGHSDLIATRLVLHDPYTSSPFPKIGDLHPRVSTCLSPHYSQGQEKWQSQFRMVETAIFLHWVFYPSWAQRTMTSGQRPLNGKNCYFVTKIVRSVPLNRTI